MTDSKPDVLSTHEREALTSVVACFSEKSQAGIVARALLRLAPEPVKPVVRIGGLVERWRAIAAELRRNNLYTHDVRASELDWATDELEAAIRAVDVETVAEAIATARHGDSVVRDNKWPARFTSPYLEECRDASRVVITAILGVKP